MGVTVSWDAARSPSPAGFARQPTLGALDRNAVTGERIPVQPGCQQFIVQVGAVLGVRDATFTAEVLQPVLGFLPQVAEEAQVGPVSPLAGQAAVTERQASSQRNRSSASSGSSGGGASCRLLGVTMMPSRYPGGAIDPSTAATASSKRGCAPWRQTQPGSHEVRYSLHRNGSPPATTGAGSGASVNPTGAG